MAESRTLARHSPVQNRHLASAEGARWYSPDVDVKANSRPRIAGGRYDFGAMG